MRNEQEAIKMNTRELQVIPLIIMILALLLTACAAPGTPQSSQSPDLSQSEVPAALPITAEPVATTVFALSGECNSEIVVDFEDLELGSTYNVGDIFQDSGTKIVVQAFQWLDGTLTTDGKAIVHGQGQLPMIGNTGHYLFTNNVNLGFLFDFPLNGLSYRFAYSGGNNNLKVNDTLLNFTDFAAIDGTQIDNVLITVTVNPAKSSPIEGVIKLDGSIESVSIGGGGQEFAIDDVCPM